MKLTLPSGLCDPYRVTVLETIATPDAVAPKMQKQFVLEGGRLKPINFSNAYQYSRSAAPLRNIRELADLVDRLSSEPTKILIRGAYQGPPRKQTQRLKELFPEPPEGVPWVMLDFDDTALPPGIDPLTAAAIEHVVQKLPNEFQDVSYYYQHSSSAGVLKSDGSPLKSGLNAHVFFWLAAPIPGPRLCAYLKSHCFDVGFYTVGPDKGGSVRVIYGFDPALLRSSVQPHYISSPWIGPGVDCRLKTEARQGFVAKPMNQVALPALPLDLERTAQRKQDALTDAYKRKHGFVPVVHQTSTEHGIATSRCYVNPNNPTNRTFVRAALNATEQIATLYFEEESSPGSWFVVRGKHSHMAYKHGGDRMLLRELSFGSHEYVRDTLGWFTEVPGHLLQLTPEGYLPAISSFAKAKVSLILSPTGSGKTQRVVEWVAAFKTGVQVYCAVTTALVNQMRQDLRSAGVPVHFYKDVIRGETPQVGVIVTTNKSLRRILDRLHDQAIPHQLILDEIHAGFDEFMRKSKVAESFELALAKAERTLMLTGTLTELQRSKIAEVVGHALSGRTERHFCRYEFAAVKRNPLVVRPTEHFDGDFISLIDDLAEKRKRDLPLPRVVLILPTSSLEAYRDALRDRDLLDLAQVVSRTENFEDEIEAARVGTVPILIASPLFAVGLNFERQPDIFWASFVHIDVDKNQIVQTLNRANRGSVVAEVRLYANPSVDAHFKLPSSERLKPEVAERFRGEATLQGVLDGHFQVDLATYRLMREVEKDTYTAISELVSDDAIQNYTVVEESPPPKVNRENAETFKAFKRAARAKYVEEIVSASGQFAGAEIGELFMALDGLQEEKLESWRSGQSRLEKELNNDRLGIVMALCGVGPSEAKDIDVPKLRRIFADIGPWTSAQFDQANNPDWAKAQAEKSEGLARLLSSLIEVRDEHLDPAKMSAALTRGPLGYGFLSLCGSDVEFVKSGRKLAQLAEARKQVRDKGSTAQRLKVWNMGMDVLADFLEPIGVRFEAVVVEGKRQRDYSKLRVPQRWPLTAMRTVLLRRAQSLRRLDPSQGEQILRFEPTRGQLPPVSIAKCGECVHLHQLSCVLGFDVDWQDDQSLTGMRNLACEKFRQFKAQE